MDPTFLALIAAPYVTLSVIEWAAPARRLPAVRRWRLKGIAFVLLYLAVATSLPMLWDAWLGSHRLIDATGLGTAGGAIVGLLALELGTYLWHRTMHRVPLLWRWFHQVHHSAERIDMAGAFYFSPLDMVGFTAVGSLALVWAVGVTPEAAILANLGVTYLAMFQHANVRTPRWLGYLVQRPENHALHHERGVHAWNYGNIALWDQLLGTWRNPAHWDAKAGFFDGASARLPEMLLGRDIAAAGPADPSPASDVRDARDADVRWASQA